MAERLFVFVMLVVSTAVSSQVARAEVSDLRVEEFEKVLARPELSPAAVKQFRAARENLDVTFDFSEWVFKKRPAAFNSALAHVASQDFAGVFERIQNSCGVKISKIELGIRYAYAFETMSVNAIDKALTRRLAALPAQCEAVRNEAAKINAAIEPRAVSYEISEVFGGWVTKRMLDRWSAALSGASAPALLDSYELSCRRPLRSLHLGTISSYEAGRQSLVVNRERSPVVELARISYTATACAATLDSLAQLNTEVSATRGVLFTLDADRYFHGTISPAQVLAWIEFLRADPERISKLRAAVLKGSKPRQYLDQKRCMGDSMKTEADCNKKLITVDFGEYTRIRDYSTEALMVFWMGGLPISIMMVVDGMVSGEPVSLNVTAQPAVPDIVR